MSSSLWFIACLFIFLPVSSVLYYLFIYLSSCVFLLNFQGRGYVDKGRPPNDRYRDTGAPWERRTDRDFRDHRKPFEEPGIRDRHSRDTPPLQQGFRDQRPWEDRDRRGSPPRGGNIPPQERRPPYDTEHEVRGRPEPRERRSLERGAEGWEYEEDVNQR